MSTAVKWTFQWQNLIARVRNTLPPRSWWAPGESWSWHLLELLNDILCDCYELNLKQNRQLQHGQIYLPNLSEPSGLEASDVVYWARPILSLNRLLLMLRITAESNELYLEIKLCLSLTSHVRHPLEKPGNSGSNRWIQCLSLSDSAPPIRNVHTRNSWASCWLPDTLVLFPGSCARQPEKRLPHASCIAENRTVLCGLTHVMIFILHFRPLWRCVWATGWYYSLWSTRFSNVLSRQNSFCLLSTNVL